MISSCRGHEDNWRCRGELRVDRESHERICIRPNLDQVGACEGNNDGFHASLPVPFFRLDPGCVARRAMRLSPLLFMRSWRPGSVRGGLPAHSDMPLDPERLRRKAGPFSRGQTPRILPGLRQTIRRARAIVPLRGARAGHRHRGDAEVSRGVGGIARDIARALPIPDDPKDRGPARRHRGRLNAVTELNAAYR